MKTRSVDGDCAVTTKRTGSKEKNGLFILCISSIDIEEKEPIYGKTSIIQKVKENMRAKS